MVRVEDIPPERLRRLVSIAAKFADAWHDEPCNPAGDLFDRDWEDLYRAVYGRPCIQDEDL
jgi:hypothetical protein